MPKSNPKTLADFLPCRESPFSLEPEALPPSAKYGWSPSQMDGAEEASGLLDSLFSGRENALKESRKIGILEGLLQEVER